MQAQPTIAITPGMPHDAGELAPFAQRVFRQTFENDPDHKPSDMALFFATALSETTLAAELLQAETTYYLARYAGVLIGYLKVSEGHAPDCVPAEEPLEIARLYVDFSWHKRGVAHQLMEHGVRQAEALGCDGLWLGVWHRNHRAQKFYRKWGFEHVGEHPFIFGTDLQTDLVFARSMLRA